MGVNYSNDIHPFWSSQGCTTCHTNANILDLTAAPGSLCVHLRDDNTVTPPPSPYLDDPTCSAGNSWIIAVPGTGSLPSGAGHSGGTSACFQSGGNCRDTILLWCMQNPTPICP